MVVFHINCHVIRGCFDRHLCIVNPNTNLHTYTMRTGKLIHDDSFALNSLSTTASAAQLQQPQYSLTYDMELQQKQQSLQHQKKRTHHYASHHVYLTDDDDEGATGDINEDEVGLDHYENPNFDLREKTLNYHLHQHYHHKQKYTLNNLNNSTTASVASSVGVVGISGAAGSSALSSAASSHKHMLLQSMHPENSYSEPILLPPPPPPPSLQVAPSGIYNFNNFERPKYTNQQLSEEQLQQPITGSFKQRSNRFAPSGRVHTQETAQFINAQNYNSLNTYDRFYNNSINNNKSSNITNNGSFGISNLKGPSCVMIGSNEELRRFGAACGDLSYNSGAVQTLATSNRLHQQQAQSHYFHPPPVSHEHHIRNQRHQKAYQQQQNYMKQLQNRLRLTNDINAADDKFFLEQKNLQRNKRKYNKPQPQYNLELEKIQRQVIDEDELILINNTNNHIECTAKLLKQQLQQRVPENNRIVTDADVDDDDDDGHVDVAGNIEVDDDEDMVDVSANDSGSSEQITPATTTTEQGISSSKSLNSLQSHHKQLRKQTRRQQTIQLSQKHKLINNKHLYNSSTASSTSSSTITNPSTSNDTRGTSGDASGGIGTVAPSSISVAEHGFLRFRPIDDLKKSNAIVAIQQQDIPATTAAQRHQHNLNKQAQCTNNKPT